MRRTLPRAGLVLATVAVLSAAVMVSPAAGTTPSIRTPFDVSTGPDILAGSQASASSLDGRYIAFATLRSDLVAGDAADTADVFVYDRSTGRHELVSTGLSGKPAAGDSYRPSISADGRFVAFDSWADNLVAGGHPGATNDVYVRDRNTGRTTRVSDGQRGARGNGSSFGASISADGRWVAFTSQATNLVSGDTNLRRSPYDARDTVYGSGDDVFVRDRGTAVTTRVSVATGGAQADGPSGAARISADGQSVTFSSYASNLGGASAARTSDPKEARTYVTSMSLATKTAALPAGSGARGAAPSVSALKPYAPGTLAYAPPALTSQVRVIQVPSINGGPGDQCSSWDRSICRITLRPGQDAEIRLPRNAKRYGGIAIIGGHNVKIIGGYITIPTSLVPDTDANDYERSILNFKRVTGTVHIEGVRIDASGTCAAELVCGTSFDAIKLDAQDTIVQIENTRIIDPATTRVNGKTLHSDAIQASGGVRELRTDRVTIRSKFNNLQLRQEDDGTVRQPIGPLYFRRTDIQIMPDAHANAIETGLGPGRPSLCGSPPPKDTADGCAVTDDKDPDNCRPSTGVGPGADAWGVTFDQFYANQPVGRAVNDLVQPGSNSHCPSSAIKGQLHWAHWENGSAQPREVGRITLGAPPQGDFAPGCYNGLANSACPGLNYTSPGYTR